MPLPRPASGDTIYIIHASGSITNSMSMLACQYSQPKMGPVMWATTVPIFVFLGLSVLDLGPMYATGRRQTNRQTDVRQYHCLMPPPRGRGITSCAAGCGPVWGRHNMPPPLQVVTSTATQSFQVGGHRTTR